MPAADLRTEEATELQLPLVSIRPPGLAGFQLSTEESEGEARLSHLRTPEPGFQRVVNEIHALHLM